MWLLLHVSVPGQLLHHPGRGVPEVHERPGQAQEFIGPPAGGTERNPGRCYRLECIVVPQVFMLSAFTVCVGCLLCIIFCLFCVFLFFLLS